MGLREVLRRFIPEETATFDEFLELIRQRGDHSVEAHMSRNMIRGSRSSVVGYIGDFEYFNRYTSGGKNGRVVFDEKYEQGTVFGSEDGFADYETRDRMWTLLAVTALNRLAGVRGSMPGVQTTIFHGDARVPQDMLQKLSRVQEQQHLTPLAVKR